MYRISRLFKGCPVLSITLGILMLSLSFSDAAIMYEHGTLREFLGGSCQDCAYDNWISHVSEGIAAPGLNDYGPLELDPQSNGFGHYQIIESDSSGNAVIACWYDIFTHFLDGDTAAVENLLESSGLDTMYQLVVLTDDLEQYYILREVLNLSYYDAQLTLLDSTDDVRGSFDFGWGIYVYSPFAIKSEVIVEVPHPCDDFIAPFIATDVFESWQAGILMIAGAGREVAWTGVGEYNNTMSLSDPSRNSQTVFHAAHRAFVDSHSNNFAIQVHSYDTQLHPGLSSLIISAGPDDPFPNEPVLDRCAYDDMISLTPYIPVPANTCGNHPNVTVDLYYQIYYEGGYHYQGNFPVILNAWDLQGYGQNRQLIYSHIGHNHYRDPENFLHIEMDELPNVIRDSVTVFYRTDLSGGVTFDNFSNALTYYRPAYQALLQALEYPAMVFLLNVTPSSLQFPGIRALETDTLSIVFQNRSHTDTLLIQDVYVNNSAFSVFSAPIGISLVPSQPCSVQVVFQPQNVFSYSGILTFSTDQGCSHVVLHGTGLGAVAYLSPSSVNFYAVPINMGLVARAYLRNGGNYQMQLMSVIDSPPHFLCNASPDNPIAPFGQYLLNLTFLPLENGLFRDTLYIVTDAFNSDTLMLKVQGEGGYLPAAPQHMTIAIEESHITLTWNRVTITQWGSPMTVNAYSVYYTENLMDRFRYLAETSDTTLTFSIGFPFPVKNFYQVRAQGSSNGNVSFDLINPSNHDFQLVSP